MGRVPITLLLVLCACGDDAVPERAEPRVRLWHTFNPTETEALNDILADDVEPTLLPFQRAQTIVAEELAAGEDCPDLVRIDATWLPGLVRDGLLEAVPNVAAERRWLPEAEELAAWDGADYGLPQSIDGLALIYRRDAVAEDTGSWPPQTVGELLATAHRLTGDGTWGLGVRGDGYWFLPFLRAWGGRVLDPDRGDLGIDERTAARALERFADLFGNVAPPPSPTGTAERDEIRRFRAGHLPILLNGPWALADLGGGDLGTLGVAPFPPGVDERPAAPRGAQLFVVPRCARNPKAGWALAEKLTAPELQADWARRFGVVPTTAAGLQAGGELARSFYRALQRARPLPRHPITAELFDDLNPAIAAVVAEDATAEEALAGVARAWRRLMLRHGIAPEPAAAPRDAGAGEDAR